LYQFPRFKESSGAPSPCGGARQAESYQKGICPHCKTATMITIEIMPTRGPPQMKGSIKIFEIKTEK